MMKKAATGTLSVLLNIVVYAVIIFLIYRAVLFAFNFSYEVFGNTAMSQHDDTPVAIDIKDGYTSKEIAALLSEKGIIKYEMAFTIRMSLEGAEDNIVPGTYEVNETMTTEDIIMLITGSASESETAGS